MFQLLQISLQHPLPLQEREQSSCLHLAEALALGTARKAHCHRAAVPQKITACIHMPVPTCLYPHACPHVPVPHVFIPTCLSPQILISLSPLSHMPVPNFWPSVSRSDVWSSSDSQTSLTLQPCIRQSWNHRSAPHDITNVITIMTITNNNNNNSNDDNNSNSTQNMCQPSFMTLLMCCRLQELVAVPHGGRPWRSFLCVPGISAYRCYPNSAAC